MSANRMAEMLGLDPIPTPGMIDIGIRAPRPTRSTLDVLPTIPAATPEDQLAREIVAAIEIEDGWDGCAKARLRGAYDGDTEHRIALAAIHRTQINKQSERDGA